ncbi:MAG TPA: penicillin-binding protein 2 [Sporichthyaceae bacterium]|jgi:penicillin-binding protein 2|nr:penicillin-binding protein 2 [Sporichthyaceae bacterium]
MRIPASVRRVFLVQCMLLCLMLVLGGRLWFLQGLRSGQYVAAADANTVREVVVPAARGLILDDMGRVLVRNKSRTRISIDRSLLLAQPDRGAKTLDRLAAVLSVPADKLRAQLRLCGAGVGAPCWSGSPYQPIPVADNVDPSTALAVSERREDFPGVSVDQLAVRDYPAPYGVNAAHILGYVAAADEGQVKAQRVNGAVDPKLGTADLVGQSGLEQQYDSALRGRAGVSRISVDHLGHVLGPVGETPAVPGDNLVTTIDSKVQALAEQQLAAAIDRARHVADYRGRKYPADSGAVVVLDVNTGAVVAMAGAPSYDPSAWVGGISPDNYTELTGDSANQPLLDRPIAGGGAPGSTFKVITTAAALSDGYDPEKRWECSSSFGIGGRAFGNYEGEAYGFITMARAVEVSCDTVFYRVAYEMWQKAGGSKPAPGAVDPIQDMAHRFGLGKRTGIDLPGESPGRIVDRDWKHANWLATRVETCKRALTGYPELAATDPKRAAFLTDLAKENCTDGYLYRGGDAANLAIGQGDTAVTPLQLARVYAAIANGGTMWRPHVAKAELSPTGTVVHRFGPVSDGKVGLPDSVLDYIRQALVGVTTKGTAQGDYHGWPLAQIPVAAKTGTAEHFGEQPTSWFAGFVPAGAHPQYAVVMTVSHGGTGSGTSGLAVRTIEAALLGVGEKPFVPNGQLPAALPVARPDGSFREPR